MFTLVASGFRTTRVALSNPHHPALLIIPKSHKSEVFSTSDAKEGDLPETLAFKMRVANGIGSLGIIRKTL